MEKLLTTLFLQAVFKDVKTTKALVDIIFNENTEPKVVKNRVVNKSLSIKPSVVPKVVGISDKKQEVLDAIQFLKNKQNKTKVDREKIQMLEVVLKTV
jgi:hypothetical protein